MRIGATEGVAPASGRYERLLATLLDLRGHACTRALAIGLHAHPRHGRYTIVALAKTRIRAGQRDYLLFEEQPEWEIEPDSAERTRILLECLVADWPEDKPLFAFKSLLRSSRGLGLRSAVRNLIEEEKVLIQPIELARWHEHWIGQQARPAFDRDRSDVQVRRHFGRRAAAVTLASAALAACSTTSDVQTSARPRYATPIAFHMHQPSDQSPRVVAPRDGMIPRTADGIPLALHMHQPSGTATSAPRPVAPPVVASRNARPLAFHLHQPMAPLVLADVTATAGTRPALAQTAATEPVKVPAVVLAPEPARVQPMPNLAAPVPQVIEERAPPVTIALAPQRAAENVRPAEPPRPVVSAAASATPRGAAVFFARGASLYSREEADLLRDLAAEAKASRRILIVGRTDLSGAQRINEQIGMARALRVKNTLVRLGVDPARIEVRVDTSGQAMAPNALRTATQPNDRAGMLRRVDIVFN